MGTASSIAEHLDVLYLLLGVFVAITSFLIVRALRQIDANYNSLLAKVIDLCKEVARLQGEHDLMKMGKRWENDK